MTQNINNPASTSNFKDFSNILRIKGVKYREIGNEFLIVGTCTARTGWIIDISVIKSQISQALNAILPEIAPVKIPFKVVRDEKTAHLMLNGSLGYEQVGKIISIFPPDESTLKYLTEKLIKLTLNFEGPSIPTDAHLGGCVYVRHGNFQSHSQATSTNQIEENIPETSQKFSQEGCQIPFRLANNVSWPFDFTPPPPPQSIHVLNNTYLVTSELKSDVKGKVFKTLRVKNWKITRAVVKEANHHINIDKYGRDIVDRLRWQYQVQTELCAHIPIPKTYDLFNEQKNCYLAMEYVSGKILSEFFSTTFDGVPWSDLSLKNKETLIDVLIQVLSIVKKLHNLGYVHRDISPGNFILTRKNRVTLIDLEGAYSITHNQPSPPFDLGTPGFISPEQSTVDKSSPEEDIYSLGALIFVFFTGLSPAKFLTDHPDRLNESLSIFKLDTNIHDLILKCLNPLPKNRPTLPEIIETIQTYEQTLKKGINTNQRYNKVGRAELLHIITKALSTFDSPTLADEHHIWYATPTQNEQIIGNRQAKKTYYNDISAGVCGGLYTIAEAVNCGIQSNRIKSIFHSNFKYLKANLVNKSYKPAPGLYFGSAGIAVTVTQSIKMKLVVNDVSHRELVKSCFENTTDDMSVANGKPGQYLALAQCKSILSGDFISKTSNSLISSILNKQNSDGSWSINGEKFTGISQGAAGVIIALLTHRTIEHDRSVDNAIVNALHWLTKKAIRRNSTLLWRVSNKTNIITPWLNKGIGGIALCYLRAFDTFKDPSYEKKARSVLDYLSQHIVQDNITWADGLCGLGEVFIEGAKILNSDHYASVSDNIAQLLIQARYESGQNVYWIAHDKKIPTISLADGCSGIIHYLLRHNYPEHINIPLFGSDKAIQQTKTI